MLRQKEFVPRSIILTVSTTGHQSGPHGGGRPHIMSSSGNRRGREESRTEVLKSDRRVIITGVGVVRTQAGYSQSGRGWWCQAGDLVFKSTFTVIHDSMGVGSRRAENWIWERYAKIEPNPWRESTEIEKGAGGMRLDQGGCSEGWEISRNSLKSVEGGL